MFEDENIFSIYCHLYSIYKYSNHLKWIRSCDYFDQKQPDTFNMNLVEFKAYSLKFNEVDQFEYRQEIN